MEQQDRDYEHCGDCRCLSECGCGCSECRGAVRTMNEIGHDHVCAGEPVKDSALDALRKELKEKELQIDDLKTNMGHADRQCIALGRLCDERLKKLEESNRLNGELASCIRNLKRMLTEHGYYKATSAVMYLIDDALAGNIKCDGSCCKAAEQRMDNCDCECHETEKRVVPVCFVCGAEATGKIGAEPRCERHV